MRAHETSFGWGDGGGSERDRIDYQHRLYMWILVLTVFLSLFLLFTFCCHFFGEARRRTALLSLINNYCWFIGHVDLFRSVRKVIAAASRLRVQSSHIELCIRKWQPKDFWKCCDGWKRTSEWNSLSAYWACSSLGDKILQLLETNESVFFSCYF